jgi:hypothetical protein
VGDFFEAIENLGWVGYIAHTNVPYGFFTVLHYFTLFVMTGTVVTFDLHLLGFVAKDQTSTQFADEIFPWTWTAMGLAIFSGATLWLCEAGDYWKSPAMNTKLVIILFAFLTTWLIRRGVRKWGDATTTPASGKLLAVISLLLWLGAILWGNNIAALCGLG